LDVVEFQLQGLAHAHGTLNPWGIQVQVTDAINL
jgi:hypothetical protein